MSAAKRLGAMDDLTANAVRLSKSGDTWGSMEAIAASAASVPVLTAEVRYLRRWIDAALAHLDCSERGPEIVLRGVLRDAIAASPLEMTA